MFNKINVKDIIIDHLKTLRDIDADQLKVGDFVTFIFLPMIITLILVYFKINMSDDIINVLIASFSIFVGLLLNLLVIIYNIVDKNSENEKQIKNRALKYEYLREVFSNISFAILISVLTIIFLFISLTNFFYIQIIFKYLSIFMTMLFLLTLLMILKRVHILLSKEFKS